MSINVGSQQAVNDQPQVSSQPSVASNQGSTLGNVFNGNGASPNNDYLGVGGEDFGFIPMKEGSEYTNKVSKGIEEVYKKMSKPQPGVDPFIITLDNTIYSKMVYSIIVVLNRISNLEFHYHYIILEATGTQPFTAREVADRLNNARRQYQNSRAVIDVYVPGDANDLDMYAMIGDILKRKLNLENNKIDLVSVDGLVLHKDIEVTDEVFKRLAIVSYNALWGEFLATKGITNANFNIAKFKAAGASSKTPIKGMAFVNETASSKTATDELGSPVRADFRLALEAQLSVNNALSLNARGSNVYLTKVMGFVDPIPFELVKDIPSPYGVQKAFVKKFIPNIVITSVDVKCPTIEYMLLGLTSAVVESNLSQWPSSLDINTVGALNVFTDLNNVVGQGKGVVGEKFNLSKQPFDKSFKIIREMFDENPIISIDISASGPQTFYTSVLAVASAPATDSISIQNKEKASKAIISAAHELTNGAFPIDYPVNEIFVGPSILIPLGTWEDKTGVRDIRDIDYAWIASHTDDTSLLQQWALTSTPSNNGGYDPFLTRIEIISRFIETAKITGKAARATFTARFIKTLTDACRAAGLDATYTPLITLSENTNIQVLGNYFSNAGVGNAAQFANTAGGQGFAYNTPYVYFQY